MKNPIINLLKYTFKYSYDQKWRMTLSIVLATLGQLVLLLNPWVVSRIFNTVQFSPDDPGILRFVLLNLLFLLIIEVASWMFGGTGRVIERRFHFIIRKNYKQAMFERVLDLSAAWHKDHHSGETIDKINTASQALYIFSGRIFFLVRIVIGLFGSMIALIFFDWRATLIALGTAILVFTFMFGLDRWLQGQYKKLYKFENKFASAIHDYITNVMTVITLKLKNRVVREIDKRGLAGYPIHHKVEFVDEMKWVTIGILISCMTVVALGVNALVSFRTQGVIAIGTLFALYGYLRSVGDTFYNIAFRYGEMVRENSAVEGAEGIVRAHESREQIPDQELPPDWKVLSIENLVFSYNQNSDDEEEVNKKEITHLDDISITMKKGERIAFVGESGSGKSTLLALLRGLYSPEKATLHVDGVAFPGGLTHLYSHITLVPQDPEIFNSTVLDNITMEVEVSEDDLSQAIRLARFDGVVERLPKGLETNVLEKGVSLSGGEKQRLALARGILAARDADILFLDEPTSSVDAINETAIYEGLFKELGEKTIVSTIHRLHLLHNFDTIYHFEKGKLLAHGTLAELLETPDFKKLWEKYTKKKS